MSPPHAVQSGVSSVDVFAVGSHSELLHWQFRIGAWTSWPIGNLGRVVPTARHVVPPTLDRNWESLGGILVTPPRAVMFGELNDIILAFALGTDHALWIKEFYKGSWREWATYYGHTLNSPPHAVRWQSERYAVFALGTDSAVWYTMGDSWQSLGGAFSSAPYAVTTSNHIHVFAADMQSALKHCSWNGNSWSDWESLGGILMSPPRCKRPRRRFDACLCCWNRQRDMASSVVGGFMDGLAFAGWDVHFTPRHGRAPTLFPSGGNCCIGHGSRGVAPGGG
jgi:hypothetical protein